jgi:hypothetical protein
MSTVLPGDPGAVATPVGARRRATAPDIPPFEPESGGEGVKDVGRREERGRRDGDDPRAAGAVAVPAGPGPVPPPDPAAPRHLPEGDQTDRRGRPMRPLGLVDFCARNPRRPTNWRWLRAGRLLELGLRWSRRRDDAQVRRAKHYQAALRRCRGEADRRRLACRMPDVAAAIAIVEGEPTARWAVEARLLSGERIESIARKTARTPRAVATFEALFFNVSDRLENRGYLIHIAVRLYPTPREPDLGLVWRLFGLIGGPVVLDALIDGDYGSPDRPEDERFLDELRLKLAVALKLLPIDATTAPRLIRLYLRLRQAELAAEGARRDAVDLMPNIRTTLANLPWFQPNGQSCAAATVGVEGPATGASADVDAKCAGAGGVAVG